MTENTTLPRLVVVGAWNKSIFTIDWMKQNIYELEVSDQIQVEVPIGNLDSSLRYKFDHSSFVIIGNRMEFSALPNANEQEANNEIIEKSNTIFRLLSHTPVNALGINYQFNFESKDFVFNDFFKSKDTECLESVLSGKVQNRIQRVVQLSSTETLNIIIDDNEKIIDFNFNYMLKSMLDISSQIIKDNNEILSDKKNVALEIGRSVYHFNA